MSEEKKQLNIDQIVYQFTDKWKDLPNPGRIDVNHWVENGEEFLSYAIGENLHTGHEGFKLYLMNGGIVSELWVNKVLQPPEKLQELIELMLTPEEREAAYEKTKELFHKVAGEYYEVWHDPHKMVKVSDDPLNFERREIDKNDEPQEGSEETA